MGDEQKPFKERLQSLIDEAKELVSKTTHQEIQQEGIVLFQPPQKTLICKDEDEFGEAMLKRIQLEGKIIIPQYPDQVGSEELMLRKQEYLLQGIELRIPALILPINSLMEEWNFKPYLLVFTYDGKLFIHPNDGDSFII